MNKRLLLGAGLAIAVMSTQTAQATASLLACKPEPDPEPQSDGSLKAYADELTNLTIKEVNELADKYREDDFFGPVKIKGAAPSGGLYEQMTGLARRMARVRAHKPILTEADKAAITQAQAKRERKAANRK